MAWQLLKTNYTDAVWSGMKKYNMLENDDGTVSLQDVTLYTQKENSFFGALDANRMNEALNRLMSMVENGTNIYEAFTNYFNTQKTLFENKSTQRYNEFNTLIGGLEDTGTNTFNSLKNEAAASAFAAKTSETNAKTSELNAKTSETNAKSSETSAASSASASAANLKENQEVSVRTPYIGDSGNWFTWNNQARAYVDSLTKAQGPVGPQGPMGPQGVSGVAVTAEGMFAFNVNDQGHLILNYTGDLAPDMSINDQGHLIWTV